MSPKEYKQPMPFLWWTKNVQLILFMIRELSAVFAALYVMFLLALIGLARSNSGINSPYDNLLRSKVAIVLEIIALIFVAFHSITWFNLTPKIMVVWRGEEKVSPILIAGANYALWLIFSIVVIFFIFPPQQ